MSDEPSPADAAVPCEFCRGKGQKYVHLNYGDSRSGWQWIACYACDGAGSLSGDKRLAAEAGKRLAERRNRAHPKRMVHEEAERLGLDDVELSNAELGRLPLARTLEIEAMTGREGGPS